MKNIKNNYIVVITNINLLYVKKVQLIVVHMKSMFKLKKTLITVCFIEVVNTVEQTISTP